MADDLDRQLSAYFGALAERVEPIAPVQSEPFDSGGGHRRGRAPLLVAVAIFLVVILGVGVALARSGDLPGTADGGGSSGACASIPVDLAPTQAGIVEPVMQPEDVLYFERGFNAMSGFGGPELVVADNGVVVAIDRWSPEASYRIGKLAPAGVEALRACLSSESFLSLGDYSSELWDAGGGKFCGIADASTQVLFAGPATGVEKSVTAYALDFPTPRVASSNDDCDRFPDALTDLHGAMVDLRDRVASSGQPTEPPAAGLQPPSSGD